jgi:thiamine biosynthesis lipoprotein
MRADTTVFQAIGTSAQVTVLDEAALGEAGAILRDELEAIDLACSRFRDDSEIARLNEAAGRPFAASPLLLEALAVAVRAAEETDGDVDPTVGRAMRALGWDRDFDVVLRRGEQPSFELVPAGGWEAIRIDRAAGTVRVPAGVEIDLGATAKALAADRAAARIADATETGVLVSLGGDVSVAGPLPDGGWPVLVTDDHRNGAGAAGQTVAVHGGGLATSSTTVRRWRAGDRELHHIVDPGSGLPAREHWRTVSVAADSCVAANTATTAAIVRGERAVRWLEELGLPARLVRDDGTVVVTAGWPEDDR